MADDEWTPTTAQIATASIALAPIRLYAVMEMLDRLHAAGFDLTLRDPPGLDLTLRDDRG